MKNLLIINLENKAITKTVMDYLNKNYQTAVVSDYQDAKCKIMDQYYDLFLLVTGEIDAPVIELLDEIRTDRYEFLPVIISLSKIDEQNESKAFRQRVLYLIENPMELEQLKPKLTSVSKILDFINDKTIKLSTRKYDKDYRVRQIIYFERSGPRRLKIVHEENGVQLEDEIFYKHSLRYFMDEHGLAEYFLQVHQSYLVNSKMIQKIDKSDLEVVLTNNKIVPLGTTTYYKNFKRCTD